MVLNHVEVGMNDFLKWLSQVEVLEAVINGLRVYTYSKLDALELQDCKLHQLCIVVQMWIGSLQILECFGEHCGHKLREPVITGLLPNLNEQVRDHLIILRIEDSDDFLKELGLFIHRHELLDYDPG